MYDNSITKCLLSGNLCIATCPNVVDDSNNSAICKHKKVEGRFITIGQLYFLYKTNQSNRLEDKDFLVRILSGKSMFSDSEREDFIYDPIMLLENTRSDVASISTALSDSDKEIHEQIVEIAKKVFGKDREKRKEIILSAISMHDSEPPAHIKLVLSELERPITQPNFYSFNDYVDLIQSYILDKVQLTNNEIRVILVYIICCFVSKNKDDFPTNVLKINDSRIFKIIDKTRSLSDSNPTKWTISRLKKVKSLDNVYRQLMLFDNHLYLWKIYTLPDIPVEEITENDIRAKCLLDLILNKFAMIYSSLYIILNKQAEDRNLVKIKHVISLIFDIISSKDEFKLKTKEQFFTDEMLSRQYVLTEHVNYGKMLVELAKELEVHKPTLVDIFKHLEKQEKITEYIIL